MLQESWPAPWSALDGDDSETFADELRLEVSPGHVLYGRATTVVARCGSCDSVVVQSGVTWLVVHLTWRQAAEPPQWPVVEIETNSRDDLVAWLARSDGHADVD